MPHPSPWLRAARPAAHAWFVVPLLFGQAVALSGCGRFSWRLFAWTHAMGLLLHVLIVFGRAAADGPRRGTPPPRALVIVTFGSLLATAAVAARVAFSEGRPFMLALSMLAPMLLWADSFPPLTLRKRQLDHWVHGIGTGLVLPLVGFYAQCGELMTLGAKALVASFCVAIAGGVSLSPRAARRARVSALVVIALAALATPVVFPAAPLGVVLVSAAIPTLLAFLELRGAAPRSAAALSALAAWSACAWTSSVPSP